MTHPIILAIFAVIATTYAAAWAQSPAKAGSEEVLPHDKTTLVTIADARSGIAQWVDLGEPGDSPGDIFVFDQPLLNSNHEPIGKNSGFCIRTLPGKFSECQWTLTLADALSPLQAGSPMLEPRWSQSLVAQVNIYWCVV